MTAEESRHSLYNGLMKQKKLKTPSGKKFREKFKTRYKEFKSWCWGNSEYSENCFNWLESSEQDNGKSILPINSTLKNFYKKFLCEDINWAKQTEYCKVPEDWSSGKVVADKEKWFKQFPCLKKPFTGKDFTPYADDNGYTYFINVNPANNKKYRFYSDGEIYSEDGETNMNRKWACKSGKGSGGVIFNESVSNIVITKSTLKEQISMPWDSSTPSTGGGGGNTGGGGGNTGGGTPSGWDEHCEGTDANPYHIGCKSANIGKAQGCLGSLYKGVIDDKFGNLTKNAVKQKLNKFTFTIEDLNRRICPPTFEDSDDTSSHNTSELP